MGLTGCVDGRPRAVILKPKSDDVFQPKTEDRPEEQSDRITVRGTLLLADAEGKSWGKIKVVQESGEKTPFRVSPSIMADIVRPFFDAEVIVTGHRKGRFNYLEDIGQPS